MVRSDRIINDLNRQRFLQGHRFLGFVTDHRSPPPLPPSSPSLSPPPSAPSTSSDIVVSHEQSALAAGHAVLHHHSQRHHAQCLRRAPALCHVRASSFIVLFTMLFFFLFSLHYAYDRFLTSSFIPVRPNWFDPALIVFGTFHLIFTLFIVFEYFLTGVHKGKVILSPLFFLFSPRLLSRPKSFLSSFC
jgi:hypothetical protein